MAARRCSLCGITYPTSVHDCPVCDEKTDWAGDADPDPDWQHTVDLARLKRPPSSEAQRVELWRLQECLRLGYDIPTAESLAVSDADIRQLEQLIAAGCPLTIAARIV